MRAINADALIDDLGGVYLYNTTARNAIKRVIRRQPTIEPQQRWIPVTERLPEHSCHTLVTAKWDTEYSVEYGFYWGEDNKWGLVTNNVIAWMPIPEPYREDGEAG